MSEYLHDIIVVNDGSDDGTEEVVDRLPDNVIKVSYAQNRGKGYALAQGFRKAMSMGFTHVITLDADGQHFAADIPKFIDAMTKHPKAIIVGCRNLTEDNMPRQSTFANKFSNFWFWLQTGVHLPDTQGGYRLYALSAIHGMRLLTARYEAELELLVFASWQGESLETIPVRVYYPPKEERVSHFRPVYDFARISVLNTVLCLATLVYGLPCRIIRKIRRAGR